VHDHHAVRTLVDHLTSRLGEAGLKEVAQVRIRADGTLSETALQLAYEMLTQDTPLAGSTLVVDQPAHEHLCPTCERTSTLTHEDLAGHLMICPLCGAMSAVETGEGIEIVAVSGRDPAEPPRSTLAPR
jgi:Zn finger protein HypA/HybF involved in hydrogenase expression